MENFDTSHLVEELQLGCKNVDIFPVLIGTQVIHFHSVGGGYNRERGYHIVKLIHEVQGPGSTTNISDSKNVEIHLDRFFNLDVQSVNEEGDYPNEDYKLVLKVTGYKTGPQSFSEALTAPIDKRETRYEL